MARRRQEQVKLAILVASVLAGVIGFTVLVVRHRIAAGRGEASR